jgi:hypothetical protein
MSDAMTWAQIKASQKGTPVSLSGKDGAQVSSQTVLQLKCSKCGVFATWLAWTSREVDAVTNAHLVEKHGGVA